MIRPEARILAGAFLGGMAGLILSVVVLQELVSAGAVEKGTLPLGWVAALLTTGGAAAVGAQAASKF